MAYQIGYYWFDTGYVDPGVKVHGGLLLKLAAFTTLLQQLMQTYVSSQSSGVLHLLTAWCTTITGTHVDQVFFERETPAFVLTDLDLLRSLN